MCCASGDRGRARLLFNSYEFVFVFLPLALLAYFIAARISHRLAAFTLVLASLAFYAWWYFPYVGILLGSVLYNFLWGTVLAANAGRAPRWRRLLLGLGVGGDLLVLGYFKYAGFLASTVSGLAGVPIHLSAIVLPLGISFFTFTQIAYPGRHPRRARRAISISCTTRCSRRSFRICWPDRCFITRR